jgi:hypothetical protein
MSWQTVAANKLATITSASAICYSDFTISYKTKLAKPGLKK